MGIFSCILSSIQGTDWDIVLCDISQVFYPVYVKFEIVGGFLAGPGHGSSEWSASPAVLATPRPCRNAPNSSQDPRKSPKNNN